MEDDGHIFSDWFDRVLPKQTLEEFLKEIGYYDRVESDGKDNENSGVKRIRPKEEVVELPMTWYERAMVRPRLFMLRKSVLKSPYKINQKDCYSTVTEAQVVDTRLRPRRLVSPETIPSSPSPEKVMCMVKVRTKRIRESIPSCPSPKKGMCVIKVTAKRIRTEDSLAGMTNEEKTDLWTLVAAYLIHVSNVCDQ